MKRIFLTLLVFSSIFLVFSCGSDDDDSSNSSDDNTIVGTWKLTDFTVDGVSYYDANDCDHQSTYIFESDDAFSYSNFENSTTGTGCQTDNTWTGTFMTTDGHLILNINQQNSDAGALTLMDNTFKLSYEYQGYAIVDTYTRQ